MSNVVERLKELGLTLPAVAAPVAAYVPAVRSGSLLLVSGQLPRLADGSFGPIGVVGDSVSIEQAAAGAQSCALFLLAVAANAVQGDWSKVRRCVRLGGFVRALPTFGDHAQVMNGASTLIQNVLGEAGAHARTSIGVASLPFGVAIEIEATFELAD